MKLLFPDACWRPELVSGAAFLYFHEEKVWFTLKPSQTTFLTGIDPFDFMRLVETRAPEWMPKFAAFVHLWQSYRSGFESTSELLRPLHDVAFRTMLLSYPRGSLAWDDSEALLGSSTLEHREVQKVIDPFSASDELFSHIFFERYLELYHADLTPDELFRLGAKQAAEGTMRHVEVDWTLLFEYCSERFQAHSLEELLTKAYMFRMCALKAGSGDILLSNPALIAFLASLPVVSSRNTTGGGADDKEFDVVAWEFFRQLVSPHVDPLDSGRVEKIRQLIAHRTKEIEALKGKCLKLARDFGEETNLENLEKKIGQHIRINVEADVEAVLSLDKKALRDFLDLVFSDDKTWIGIAVFIYSLLNGGNLVTAGAAIVALSSLGSKAVKSAAEKRKKLEISDYALLYRLRQ